MTQYCLRNYISVDNRYTYTTSYEGKSKSPVQLTHVGHSLRLATIRLLEKILPSHA